VLRKGSSMTFLVDPDSQLVNNSETTAEQLDIAIAFFEELVSLGPLSGLQQMILLLAMPRCSVCRSRGNLASGGSSPI